MTAQTSVFSMIIAGQLPSRAVYADDEVVAFLDIKPLTLGHTLVVPRAEVDQWQSIDPALWARVAAVSQRIGHAVQAAFSSPRVGVVVAGFDVPHVHVHVFPTYDMGDFEFSRVRARPDAEMDDAAARIRAALSGDAVDSL